MRRTRQAEMSTSEDSDDAEVVDMRCLEIDWVLLLAVAALRAILLKELANIDSKSTRLRTRELRRFRKTNAGSPPVTVRQALV